MVSIKALFHIEPFQTALMSTIIVIAIISATCQTDGNKNLTRMLDTQQTKHHQSASNDRQTLQIWKQSVQACTVHNQRNRKKKLLHSS